MKQIKVYCDRYGKVRVDNPNILLDGEHNSIDIVVSMAGLDLTNHFKRLDILVGKDKTVGWLPDDYITGDTFTVTLTSAHLKSGYLRLQPVAFVEGDGGVTEQIKWEVIELKTKYSINGNVATTQIQVFIKSYINQLLTVKDVTTNTLDGGEPATANVTIEEDGISFDFGIPLPDQTDINHYPSSVLIPNGTFVSGTLDELQTLYSGYYKVQEVTGVPGFIVEFTFTSVEKFNKLRTNLEYVGAGAEHIVNIEIYNYDTSAWVVLTNFGQSTFFRFYDLPIPDSTPYISSGESKVRIHHISSGNANHYLDLDYLNLLYTFAGSQGGQGEKGEDGELTIAGLDVQLPLKTYTRNQLKPKKVILQKLTDIRAILGSNLVAFYPLNDFEGSTAKDHSGANTHVTLSPSGITHVPSPFDEVNSAMKFDGTNSFINLVAIKDKFNGNTGAIFFDMKYEDLSEWQVGSKRLFSFYKDGNNRMWGGTGIAALNVSRYANGVLKTVTFTNQQTAANGVAFNKPFQLLATWNRTNLDLYINGILASTIASTEEFIGVPSICAYGADSASASALNVKGTHGNLGLVNRYVEAHEAKEIYNATNNQGVSMTVIGDSISNDSVDWPVYFLNNQSTYNVMRSKAVAGNSIATHMTTQTTEALKDNYDTVVILMGANDDNAGDMVALQSTVESNLSRLKRKNPYANIYVINVLPIWTNNTGTTIVDKSNIRTAIASACTAQGVTCWDSFGEQWIIASDTSDGVHPTNAGSLKLALKVKEKLGL